MSPNNMPIQAQGGDKVIAPTHSALELGGWLALGSGHFTPKKERITLLQEVEWASGPVWTARNISPLPCYNHRTFQSVVSRSTVSRVPTFQVVKILYKCLHHHKVCRI
jgi:hypothetical protein